MTASDAMSDNPQSAVAVVHFVRAWEIYFKGDAAAFPLVVAQRLVRAGIATWPPG